MAILPSTAICPWMMLSFMTAIGSYSENKLFMPLFPIWKNYPKIIINIGRECYSGRLKKALVTKISNLRSVFVQHQSKLELKFAPYFPEGLSSYEWNSDPYVQPIPSSFTEKEKEEYINLFCDSSLKKSLIQSINSNHRSMFQP